LRFSRSDKPAGGDINNIQGKTQGIVDLKLRLIEKKLAFSKEEKPELLKLR
jgi:hypothetical protein